jgi:hypothetical protein
MSWRRGASEDSQLGAFQIWRAATGILAEIFERSAWALLRRDGLDD